ncbi:hypothetical protein D9599_25580 [Roseomonas sp. KE2513]|nr:hypothetical protein [Roseomonas sp. KE2513]
MAFPPAPQNSRFSQPELDRVMRGKEWQETARTAIGGLYDVRETAAIDGKARAAFVMVGDFQDRPGLPPRARQVRTLFVIQETPRGRTSTVCAGSGSTSRRGRRSSRRSLPLRGRPEPFLLTRLSLCSLPVEGS